MVKPLSPSNTEVYIAKLKERSSQHGVHLQKMKDLDSAEIERITSQMELEQARQRLEDMRRGIKPQQPSPNVMQQLFAGKSPEEISEILEKMDEKKLQTLRAISDATNNDPVAMAMRQPNNTSREDMLLKYILELQKANQPQPRDPIEDAIKLFNLMKVVAPQPQPVSSQPQKENVFDVIKMVNEIQKPFYDKMNVKDQQINDLRMKELEAKMPASLEEQIAYVKEMAPALGLTGRQTSELDLKLEEMRQREKLDNRKMDWEMKKYEMEQDADTAKWDNITRILQGPVGQAIQGIGNAGADRVRGKGNPSGTNTKVVPIKCPNCGDQIYVDANATQIVCGSCGAVLQKPSPQPPPAAAAPPPKQPPTHVEPEPEEEAPEQEEVTEEEETESGEEETSED